MYSGDQTIAVGKAGMSAHKATMPARHLQNINCNFPGLHFGLLTYDPCLERLLVNDNEIHHKNESPAFLHNTSQTDVILQQKLQQLQSDYISIADTI